MWSDILTSAAAWGHLFSPITQFELMQTGYVGILAGADIISDAYRHPSPKVLEAGETYVLTTPEFLGGYTDRGPPVAEPVSYAIHGEPARGWLIYEIMSMVHHNPRGVSYGRRP